MALLAVAPAVAAAQQIDVIRGVISGAGGAPLEGAVVTATATPGGLTRSATTGADGRYAITLPASDGDYVLAVAAIGHAPRSVRLRRGPDASLFVADVRLQRRDLTLDTLRIRGPRPRVGRGLPTPDVGGSERPVSDWNLTTDQLGVLAVMAASVPGIQLVEGADGSPAGFSALGQGPDRNRTTMDGMTFDAASIPRDAPVRAAVATSPYDVSRGGFSGAQLGLSRRPAGGRPLRGLSLLAESPRLQWLDDTGARPAQRYSSVSIGGAAAGALRPDRAWFDLAAQVSRRWSDLATLLDADDAALAAEGLAPDSVARLLAILGRRGIPVRPASASSPVLDEQALLLGGVALGPGQAGHALGVTLSAGWERRAPVGLTPTQLPAAAATRTNRRAGVLVRHSVYLRGGLLAETALGLSAARLDVAPASALPSGDVLIVSALPDGRPGVRRVAFGGSRTAWGASRRASAELRTSLSWFSRDSRHRVQVTAEARHDGQFDDLADDRYGHLSYPSLTDLDAGRPAAFTRQVTTATRRSGLVTAALSLGDTWQRRDGLTLQYGVRADVNRFDRRPARNAALEQAFGIRNDVVPDRLEVSARVGLAWAIGRGEGASDRSLLRAGLGVFQGQPPVSLTDAALANTGLPSGARRFACAGNDVPADDWPAWARDPAGIPTACAGGGGLFADSAATIALFAPDHAAPRSVRATLEWSTALRQGGLRLAVGLTWSRTSREPRLVDRNLVDLPRFRLDAEDQRPVYAAVSDIAPGSGAVAPGAARASPAYGRVSEARADLAADAHQLGLRLAPAPGSYRLTWSLAWILSRYRSQVAGLASTAGDPSAVAWARAASDVRHQVAWTVVVALSDWVRVGLTGTLRSGAPYTPVVSGDVNGDGYANDRAFVFDPAGSADTAAAAAMDALLRRAAPGARDCLRRQLGRVAGPNTCSGPWSVGAALALSVNPARLGLSQRWSVSLQLANPLAAADLLLHGAGRRRGWGQPAQPDPILLYVRGFDPATRAWRYDVNPRFGATSPSASSTRSAARLTLAVRLDLAPVRERQDLGRVLAPGRRQPGPPADASLLRSVFATGGLANPLAELLLRADDLRLAPAQADSLARLNAWYLGRLDSIWAPAAAALAALPAAYEPDTAEAIRRRARGATVDALGRVGPLARGLLTRAQRRRVPWPVARLLDPRFLDTIRDGTIGSEFSGPLALPGGSLPSPGGARSTLSQGVP